MNRDRDAGAELARLESEKKRYDVPAAALGLLGLMRRAGKLAAGEEGVRQALRSGTVKLVLLASDASSNAQKRARDFAHRANAPFMTLNADKDTLCHALGVAGGAMFAVCDEGFTLAFIQKLQEKLPAEENS